MTVTACLFVARKLLLRGEERPPLQRGVLTVTILGGSFFAAYVLIRVYPPPWVSVSPVAGWVVSPKSRLAEFIGDRRTRLPVEYDVEETPQGRIQIRCKGWPVYPYPRWRLEERGETYGEQITAASSEVVLPEGRVEVIGLDTYCREPFYMHPDGRVRPLRKRPDRNEVRVAADGILSDFERVGFWRIDGTSVPADEWPEEETRSGEGVIRGRFVLETEGEIQLFEGVSPKPQLVLLPWGTPIAEYDDSSLLREDRSAGIRRQSLGFRFGLPVPGPLELRVPFLKGREEEHILSGDEGTVVHMRRNSIQFLRLIQGRFEARLPTLEGRSPWRGHGVPGIYRDWILELRPEKQGEPGKWCTAILISFLDPQKAEPLEARIRAVTNDGKQLVPSSFNCVNHFTCVEFPCPPEAISEFLLFERPHVAQIRFSVADIPFFPRENYALRNLLDLRVPYRVDGAEHTVWLLMSPALHSKCDLTGVQGRQRPRPNFPPMMTLREILDYYCPGQWGVSLSLLSSKIEKRKSVPRTVRHRTIQLLEGRADPPKRSFPKRR